MTAVKKQRKSLPNTVNIPPILLTTENLIGFLRIRLKASLAEVQKLVPVIAVRT